MATNSNELPVIALTPGDCTGIGPEQVARILSDDRLADAARLVVVGDARVLEMGMTHAGVKLKVERIASPKAASWRPGTVQLVDLGNTDPAKFPIGKASAESGRLTGETLSRADIREFISGNMCRCTGYHAIVDAVEAVIALRGKS